jgi:RNA polymerase-binding transcription factor DksA
MIKMAKKKAENRTTDNEAKAKAVKTKTVLAKTVVEKKGAASVASASAKPAKKAATKPAKTIIQGKTDSGKSTAKPQVKPAAKAGKPQVKTVEKPVAKVAKPAAKVVKPIAKPAAKAAKPVAKPVVKAAKPVTKPAAKAAKPIAEPIAKATAKKSEIAAKTKAAPAPAKETLPAAPNRMEYKSGMAPKKLTAAQSAATVTSADYSSEETGGERAYGSYGGIVLCENPKLFPKKTPYTEKEIKALHEMLLEERKQLRQVLRDLEEITLRRPSGESDNEVTGYSIHWAENATDNISKETALLLRRDEENTLAQVDAALERIERGLFGVCVACGEKIGMGRLKAKPEAHLCVRCKQIYDKESSNR